MVKSNAPNAAAANRQQRTSAQRPSDNVKHNAMDGAQRQELPERYGPWKTDYSRFCLWRDNGLLLGIFKALGADAVYENIMIDSTSIRVHQSGTGGKNGQSKPWVEAVVD